MSEYCKSCEEFLAELYTFYSLYIFFIYCIVCMYVLFMYGDLLAFLLPPLWDSTPISLYYCTKYDCAVTIKG